MAAVVWCDNRLEGYQRMSDFDVLWILMKIGVILFGWFYYRQIIEGTHHA
jgi:hypothetical protein